MGGLPPSENNSWEPSTLSWEDYHISETCLDGSAILMSVLTFVSNGGDDYYEKKCDNCKTDEPVPYYEGVYATAYQYESTGLDFFNIGINNSTMEDLDSVVIYIYFEATEKEVKSCGATFAEDICMSYDMAGFNKPCTNVKDISDNMRAMPQKVEGTYNKKTKTYSWEQAIPVGDLALGNRLRLDVALSSGLASDGKCDALLTAPKVDVSDGWSFTSHSASKTDPAYDGVPEWEKDQGDIQEPPRDPYIVIRSKGKLLWGYGPGETTSDRVGIKKVTPVAKARMQVGNNRLYVLATAQGTKTVKIFDMLGNQLTVKTFDGTRAEVSLANLPHRGALIARVVQGDRILATQSIMVK